VIIHSSRASRFVSLTNRSTIPLVKSLLSVHTTAVNFKPTNGQYQNTHVRGEESPAVHEVDHFSQCKCLKRQLALERQLADFYQL